MRALAWMTVLTAACGSHSGAYLDVHVDDPSIGTVALYIGDAPCMDPRTGSATACNGIAPAGETSSLGVGQSGGAWFRDSNETFTAKVVNGIAQFHLEPTGGDQTVEIIAIGYAGDPGARDAVASHVLDNVTIPAGDAIDIRTTLDAAAPVATNEDPHTPQPDGNYALVWTSINAPAECVLAEQWSGGKAKRTYIVPSEDSDCDGLLTFDESGNNRNPLECDPLWFDRKTAIASGASTCATTAQLNSASVCMIGGAACVDGVGSDQQTCARLTTEYCLPHDVCAQPCALPGAGPLDLCLDTLFIASPPMPAFRCTIYVADGGIPCSVATPTTATMDFSPLFAGSTRTCSNVRFATDSLDNYTPADNLTLPGVSAMFTTMTTNDPCSVELDWDGTAISAAFSHAWMLADLQVSSFQHLVVPISFDVASCALAPTTGNGFDCVPTFDPSGTVGVTDTMINCAQ